MASLMDLGPLTEDVEIRGVTLTVRGLTASDLFRVFSQFPDVQTLVVQLGSPGAVMMNLAPDALAKIIASSLGYSNDPKAEQKAKDLGVADLLTILEVVQRLSFPHGFGPFVERLIKVGGTPAIDLSQSSDAQETSSPEGSNAALQTDSPGMMRGTSPRVN